MGSCFAQATYQLINRAGISELQELSAPPSRAADFEASELPDVNLEIVEKRMERAVDKAAGEAKKTNSKVNIRSQKIFNELSKTMPCEWYEQGDLHCMLVYDAVRANITAASATHPPAHGPTAAPCCARALCATR